MFLCDVHTQYFVLYNAIISHCLFYILLLVERREEGGCCRTPSLVHEGIHVYIILLTKVVLYCIIHNNDK